MIKSSLQIKEKNIPSERKPVILQVEDNATTRVITSLLLRNICRIDFASNGETALNMISQKRYELILLDVNLGKGMSGIETVIEIRKTPGYESIPIIALTAFALKSDRDECLAAGFTHYLSKPFNNDELLELVEELVCKEN